jgi:hypothetical protein
VLVGVFLDPVGVLVFGGQGRVVWRVIVARKPATNQLARIGSSRSECGVLLVVVLLHSGEEVGARGGVPALDLPLHQQRLAQLEILFFQLFGSALPLLHIPLLTNRSDCGGDRSRSSGGLGQQLVLQEEVFVLQFLDLGFESSHLGAELFDLSGVVASAASLWFHALEASGDWSCRGRALDVVQQLGTLI